jgi:hypothetical protein
MVPVAILPGRGTTLAAGSYACAATFSLREAMTNAADLKYTRLIFSSKSVAG